MFIHIYMHIHTYIVSKNIQNWKHRTLPYAYARIHNDDKSTTVSGRTAIKRPHAVQTTRVQVLTWANVVQAHAQRGWHDILLRQLTGQTLRHLFCGSQFNNNECLTCRLWPFSRKPFSEKINFQFGIFDKLNFGQTRWNILRREFLGNGQNENLYTGEQRRRIVIFCLNEQRPVNTSEYVEVWD